MFTATAEFMEWRKQGKPLYFTKKQKELAEKSVATQVEE